MVVFWECSYASTSLDQLLEAMGIARSSFYAAFGSKHALMLEVLDLYTSELYGRMRDAAQAEADPVEALATVMEIIACTERPEHGCLSINMTNELAPTDPTVRAHAASYMERVDALVVDLLCRAGTPRADARRRSKALIAYSTGLVWLRKSGESRHTVRRILEFAPLLARRSGKGARI